MTSPRASRSVFERDDTDAWWTLPSGSSAAPGDVAREYLRRVVLAFRGGSPTYAELLAPEVVVTVPGTTEISGHVQGVDQLVALGQSVAALVPPDAEFDILIGDVLVEGERVAVLARGHAETASGRPYNNRYLFFFRIREGRIVELFEGCDTSWITWAVLGRDYVGR